MVYSNLIEDPKQRPGALDMMDIHLKRARARAEGQEVYVLAMSREDFDDPTEAARTFRDMPGVFEALPVNGTIDVIMRGTAEQAEELARRIHIETGQQIGYVRYEGQAPSRMYMDVRAAITTARKEGKPCRMYDPAKDSLRVIIEQAREEAARKK